MFAYPSVHLLAPTEESPAISDILGWLSACLARRRHGFLREVHWFGWRPKITARCTYRLGKRAFARFSQRSVSNWRWTPRLKQAPTALYAFSWVAQ